MFPGLIGTESRSAANQEGGGRFAPGSAMDKRRMSYFFALLGTLILLIVLLFAQGTARHNGGITLPDPDSLPSPGLSQPGKEELALVEIRPDTVQRAVASMDRAQAYTMTIRVETLWSGGSGTADLTAYVRDQVTRVDTLQLDGALRHTLTDGENVYVWYDGESGYSVYAAGGPDADRELRIPTYEDLTALEPENILEANYQNLRDLFYCIYAEAQEGAYLARYWIDVESGLLIAAQRVSEGEPVYQMTVQALDTAVPEESLFQLPDGTSLLPEGGD